jgi:hypothetical protein
MSPPDTIERTRYAGAEQAQDGDNLLDLIRQLTRQGTHLAEQQLNLIQAEVRESTREVKIAAGEFAGAAIVGIAGLGVVLMGIAYLLGDAMNNTPLATLIVGIATLALAAFLFTNARSKIASTHLSPDRTSRTLERTPDVARGQLHREAR